MTVLIIYLVNFILKFIEVQLIYKVVFIPAVQQSDSAMHTYPFLFIPFPIMVCHRILNIVACAIWEDLVSYPLYIERYSSPTVCICLSPIPILSLPHHPSNHKSALYGCLFCFVANFIRVIFQIPCISDITCYLSFSF